MSDAGPYGFPLQVSTSHAQKQNVVKAEGDDSIGCLFYLGQQMQYRLCLFVIGFFVKIVNSNLLI